MNEMERKGMNPKTEKRTSKFLSLVLRHQPQTIGIELDEAGWVDVETLLTALGKHGKPISRDALEQVVRNNDKQRFAFSPDGNQIRANQGHSVEVELEYEPSTPPKFLLHGTPAKFVAAIRAGGLKKMNRHHVHLHASDEVATAVASRRGAPVLLRVRSEEMHRDGHEFFVSRNDVWLVDHVPANYIDFPA